MTGVRWITNSLGTAPADQANKLADIDVLDVRDLVDKSGNTSGAIRKKIAEGLKLLNAGRRVVVGCDYGISRSNAIAAGIISKHDGVAFETAVKAVIAATGENEIKLELLTAVRNALSIDESETSTSRQNCILITGGAGFIASSLTGYLEAMGRKVVAMAREDLDLIHDRANLDILVREKHISHVVHLANPSVYNSNIALGNTLTMLRNILEICTNNDIRLIYPSSWEVYSGYVTNALYATETIPPLPSGPFGETKYLCETLIDHFRRTTHLKCSILRFSPIYGVGCHRPRFIHTFIEKALRGDPITTHTYRNSAAALDLLHIDDAVTAIDKALEAPTTADFNFGTNRLTSTRSIAESVTTILNSGSVITDTSIQGTTACIAMNYSRAETELGWLPRISLPDGLKTLVEYAASEHQKSR